MLRFNAPAVYLNKRHLEIGTRSIIKDLIVFKGVDKIIHTLKRGSKSMEFQAFIGVDVSKEKLDIVVLAEGGQIFHKETENSLRGIGKFNREMVKLGIP